MTDLIKYAELEVISWETAEKIFSTFEAGFLRNDKKNLY